MIVAGCDLGSATGKVVLLENGRILAATVVQDNITPERTATEALKKAVAQAKLVSVDQIDYMIGTGYGRADVHFLNENISEITCHARGAHFLHPKVRTVIDVGGQDCKVISVDETGKVLNFAMNEKCAAGTGKFFEAMSRALHCDLIEISALALESNSPVTITQQCSVFAESEVVGLLNTGGDRRDIAAGIHNSIASRLYGMLNRVGIIPDLIFSGGCARNNALRRALEAKTGQTIVQLSEDPQIVGALGAALFAQERAGAALGISNVQL
jgi:predicted CoA-substrate-specific enzyme activase